MSQDLPVIPRQQRFKSWAHLMNHLQRLGQLQTHQILDEYRKRQERLLDPLQAGKLHPPSLAQYWEYWRDFGQRSVLFWDALRIRGDNTLEQERTGFPLQLKFDYEVLVDGRRLPQPVNYSLLRIIPGRGQTVDDTRRPVIVADPRGGHGAGIGGFKQDSEIGESLRAGHPTYFIAFSHAPEPGQTLGDVADAEARFMETVTARHPEAPKPVVIGNCQAGWALMGVAAVRPELPGLVIVAGAPISYWAGVNGRNPMRYLGGLLGGSWMTRLGSDLGNGRFDGTWLVSNFESLNPSNTFWSKYYHLFQNVDTETRRFLDFERWWGSPTLLNSEEIEAIVDDLFIGNRLASRAGRPSTGVDLKRIKAPVVVFCSYGDNITPPQQALNWIVDVYPSDLALKASGRTIVYLKHASIGHLGIFVSGKVARREHRELLGAVNAISALPPGLYELIIDDDPAARGEREGSRTVHFERRHIADIKSRRDPDERDDEREFEMVSRASVVNSTLYDWLIRPWMRQVITEPVARLTRRWHPFRLQQVLWSKRNPLTWGLDAQAREVRGNRQPCGADNPLKDWEAFFSRWVEGNLDGFRDLRDAAQEMTFHATYGSLSTYTGGVPVRRERARMHDLALMERLRDALPHGGLIEAQVRVLFLLEKTTDRISKERIEQLVEHSAEIRQRLTLSARAMRDLVRLQQLLVFAHPVESLSTLPLLVPEMESRRQLLDTTTRLIPEVTTIGGAAGEMWRRLHRVLDIPEPAVAAMAAESGLILAGSSPAQQASPIENREAPEPGPATTQTPVNLQPPSAPKTARRTGKVKDKNPPLPQKAADTDIAPGPSGVDLPPSAILSTPIQRDRAPASPAVSQPSRARASSRVPKAASRKPASAASEALIATGQVASSTAAPKAPRKSTPRKTHVASTPGTPPPWPFPVSPALSPTAAGADTAPRRKSAAARKETARSIATPPVKKPRRKPTKP